MKFEYKLYSLIIISLLVVFETALSSDKKGFDYLPVSVQHPVYDYLERMEVRGFIFFKSNTRPLTRGEIVNYLGEIADKFHEDSEIYDLSNREEMMLNRYRKEFDINFSPEDENYRTNWSIIREKTFLNNLFLYKDNYNLYDLQKNDFYLTANPVLYWSFISDSAEERINHRTSGINLQVQLSKNAACFFDYRDNLESGRGPYISGERYKLYRDNAGYVEMKGEDYFFYEQSRAAVSLGFSKAVVNFGRDFNAWGSGKMGNLMLSDNAPPTDFLSFRYDPVDFLRFTYMTGELHAYPDTLTSSVIDTTSQGRIRELTDSKHIAAHRLEIFPMRGVEIGLSESVIYGQRGLEPAYLNPINMYFAAEHNLGDLDNVVWCADIELNLLKDISLYGELFIDDLKTGQIGTNWIGNKIGWIAGAYLVDPFILKDVDFICEYGRLDPFVYTHIYPVNTYKNWNSCLGYDLPPNSDRLKLLFRWNPLYSLTGSFSASFIRHGGNVTTGDTVTFNAGGDIDTPYDLGQTEAAFLDGEKMNSTIFETSVRWEPLENYFLEGKFANHSWTGGEQNEWSVTFGVNVW